MLKNLLRIFVAMVFLASGFVKAVDVVGFSFKLEEYFSPSVFNIPFLEKLALPIAIVVVSAELVLGLLLLLKIGVKKVLNLLVALCIFFAFLTFYSAFYNKVTDCGCFGDAVKFTPWQSFTKDIILLILLIILKFLFRNETNFSINKKFGIISFSGISIIFAMIILHGIRHEPLIDFRDYKIGTNLNSELEKTKRNPSIYKTFYTLKNSKTQEEKSVDQDEYVNNKTYWEDGSPWKIEEGKNTSKLVKSGYETEIVKLKISNNNGNDITESIFHAPKIYLLCSYSTEKADPKLITDAENFLLKKQDGKVLGISPKDNFYQKIENSTADPTAIKTIARSNPFILVLENGKIIEKSSAQDYIYK